MNTLTSALGSGLASAQSLEASHSRSAQRPRVVVLAYNGLCTLEFSIAVEFFALPRPEMGPCWYQCQIAAAEPGPLQGTGGVHVEVDGGLELLDGAQTIVIPGWRDPVAPPPRELTAALRKSHANGSRIMSICTGVFVIAATGLLDGRKATTHWQEAERLARAFPRITVVRDVLYVDENDILTSAGSAAGIDLGLHLIRKDFGHKAVNIVARRLVAPTHREGGQAQFIDCPVARPHEGARFGPLLERLRRHLSEPQSVRMLAADAGMSERTFLRRFKESTGYTPRDWLMRERLAEAKIFLETTSRTVEEIASICGLGTPENLRNRFRARFNCSPQAYRLRFRIAAQTDLGA